MRAALAALACLVPWTTAVAQAPPARARVTYLSGTTAYLDAGRDDGLAEGMRVSAVRGGVTVATLTVNYLASHRAACQIDSAAVGPLVVGDTVEYSPAANSVAAIATSAGAGQPAPPRRGSPSVRGRVGVRVLLLESPEGRTVTQPAVDLRLDGTALGGSPVGLLVDARARQTYSTRADGSVERSSRNGIYQAALSLRSPRTPARFTVGRQYLPTVTSVSLFDGALVEWQPARFGAGLFIGSEPDPVTMGYSSAVRTYGLFLEGRSAPGARARWSLSGGAVGSYVSGVVNREFAFVQASLSTPGFTSFVAQEFDFNRDWKAETGEPAVVPTSTFAMVGARPTEWLSLQVGFDNRRSVRLYRDLVNPEVVFDDVFRQGVWGGAGISLGRHVRFGGDARVTLGGADSLSRTRSWTATGSLERLSAAQIGLRARATHYTAPFRDGWLYSGALSTRPGGRFGLEFTAGARREVGDVAALRQTRWFGADADVGLGRSWYVLLSGSRETGEGAAGSQVFTSLSFRF